MQRVLFICSRNRLRSPTAEAVFAEDDGIEVASAGLNADSDTPLTPDLLAWAQTIFVMESAHRSRLRQRFGKYLKAQRVICLDIADRYAFMDPDLIQELRRKVARHL